MPKALEKVLTVNPESCPDGFLILWPSLAPSFQGPDISQGSGAQVLREIVTDKDKKEKRKGNSHDTIIIAGKEIHNTSFISTNQGEFNPSPL